VAVGACGSGARGMQDLRVSGDIGELKRVPRTVAREFARLGGRRDGEE
jgi:hypothetical protein